MRDRAGDAERGVTSEVLAAAKINLELVVVGRMADGYHELRTTMLSIGLGDRVWAEAREEVGVELAVSGEHADGVPEDAGNLAWRAAEALIEEAGCGRGVRLELEKRVPAGAGLGGGSADAAAALVAVRAALGLGEDAAVDEAILGRLGSDTVFFRAAASGHALCEGRGERVTPRAALGDWSIMVLTPAVHAETRAVYGAFDFECAAPPPEGSASFEGCTATEARERLFNHLEAPALGLYPELSAWRGALDSVGLEHARLTGSGASFFALFDEEAEAQEALERVLEGALGLPRLRLACVTAPAGGVSLLS